ncbi:NAD(P)-dependent oxidoreductase [Plantibacter sp. YIM 135249]|uniref:NAD(P)-dependent oxidoreductase n=1 Tax=Plantibacter sp. YIM 135249 TaxID=3423918 RepID=UPI003D348213
MSSQRGPRAALPTTVGVIGLGAMGAPMTRNLLAAAGSVSPSPTPAPTPPTPLATVLVNHRSRDRAAELLEAGAVWAGTPRELAAADVIVFMLPDLPQVDEVLDGADGVLAGIDSPTVLVIGSTSSAQGVRDLDSRVSAATGGLARVIDAPVSGGEDGARAATLSIMVGGDKQPVEAAWSTLETFGTPVHLGPLGSGEIAKYCNQIIVASTIMALGEAAVLADRSGLDVGAMFDLLEGGYAGSRVLATRKQRIVDEDYSPSGPAKFMVKDLTYATIEAERTGTTAPQLHSLLDQFTRLTEEGYGDQDISVTRAYIDSLTPPRTVVD